MNKINLNKKNAVVTGGAQGFGLAITKRFIASGANVAIWDIDKNVLDILSLDGNILKIEVDVTNYQDVEKATAETINFFKSVDIFVNNAGIAGPNFTTWEYPIDEWQKVIDIDLTGTFYCCHSIIPHMIKENYGRVINISSIAGKEGNPNAMPYSAAKAGVIALTKSLGKELAKYNIAVNCVTPAAAKTRIFDQISEEHINYMLSKIPRNRFVKVEELASMVSWLASEENSFTTGAVFDLSGGRATY
jgi:3-oxoacyl-[acyl-carrier protein] reductase|tara:strand:+ start:374 stop:1114 length:741 start_codon:yes stop_codon:yes gene_type:complete